MKKIVYDFDGTLTPFPIPRLSILEKCGYEDGAMTPRFVSEVRKRMELEKIDLYTSFYKTMFDRMMENAIELTDDNFSYGASDIQYNKGVVQFLDNLNKNEVYNYVLSSGIKVYLEKTKIYPFVKGVYGTTFLYDKNNVAYDFDILMSDSKKVDGIKDILKNLHVENFDCSDFVYIGDGLTDLDAMRFVKERGGTTIFVYQNLENLDVDKVENKDIVDFYFEADYSRDSELTKCINKICGIESEKVISKK